jgi:hypothetical protein
MEKKIIKIKFVFKQEFENWIKNHFVSILEKHYKVEFSEKPDYIFYNSHEELFLDYDCIRISWTGENVRPDFNFCDYALGFDYMSFEDRYLRYPLYLLNHGYIERASQKHLNVNEKEMKSKLKFCNFIVSNGFAGEMRSVFFDLLCNYKIVDSGGKYKNNLGYFVDHKLKFQSQYKFTICFENSSTSGYITEKLIQAVASCTIPIYWGDYNAFKPINEGGGGINKKSLISIHDYRSLDEVVQVIKEIDNDQDLYFLYLKEPFFLDDDHLAIFNTKLELFLKNIFDQPIKSATRRGFGQARSGIENRYKEYLRLNNTKNMIKELKKRILKKLKFSK